MTAAAPVSRAAAAPATRDAPGLLGRLREAARVLVPEVDARGLDATDLLGALVRAVRRELTAERMWLLMTAVATVMPRTDELRAMMRTAELEDDETTARHLLAECLDAAFAHGNVTRPLRVVEHTVLADVDFSARNDVHTGIQRVVRSTLPHWVARRDLVTTAWAPLHGALRTLTDDEQSRVLRWAEWRSRGVRAAGPAPEPVGDEGTWELVVPWRCVVVLADVPQRFALDRLAALAEHSGNAVVAVGYDCIPVVSAHLVPLEEPNRFVTYLSVVKHMRRVAGISVSATSEFDGFAQMLATQGLPGPEVVECALPAEVPDPLPPHQETDRPSVLCIGSFEPRKNQLGVLHAAEVLWREGLDFELRFVGGGGVSRTFPGLVRRLAARGRPVEIATGITDAELNAAYARARCTVFPSIHEGYGLPVAESMAHGTPVVTTDYGSTREIGAPGGAVLVDPRDDDQLVAALRRLLTDDGLVARLRAEIAERPGRTWADYADELWAAIVEPELTSPAPGARP